MMVRAPIISIAVRREEDIMLARQRAGQISQSLGFSLGDTTGITTAVSQIARNAIEYAGGGRVTYSIGAAPGGRQELTICVSDAGPGISNVADVVSGHFKSRGGMGSGIRGSQALMDHLSITSTLGGGTTVVMSKLTPKSAVVFGPSEIARLMDELARGGEAAPVLSQGGVDHASSDDTEQHRRVLDLGGRSGEQVAIDHHQVREPAGGQ